MRRIFIFTLAIALIFSLFAVPASAASYDFSSVSVYQDWSELPNYLAPIYVLDEDSNTFELDSVADSSNSFFGYYPKGFKFFSDPGVEPYWTFGDRSYFVGQTLNDYRDSRSGSSNVFISAYNYNRTNSIILPGFEFHGVYLPSAGQYISISFSLDVFQFGDLPNIDLLNFQNLFFLAPIDPTNSTYPVEGTIPCNTVVRSVNESVANYQVFFDVSDVAFLGFSDEQLSRPFKLVIRIPFYNSFRSSGRVMYINDAAFPSSYDILTIGGYEEVLDNIENAVVKGFDDLDDLLTIQDPDDTLVITQLDAKFDELDQTLNDYDDAMQPVFQMKELYTHPPVANIIQSNTSQLDTSDVKDFLSLPWIISAFSMIFAFCIIRLILFGTKEG